MPPLLKLLWTVGSKKSVKDSFDFEFQSRLHECEATTARDKFILLAVSRYAFVCRLFLLPESRLQLNDRLDGIWFCQDLLCEQRERNNAAVRLRGRNRKTTFRQTGKTPTGKTAEMSYAVTSRETVLTVSIPIGFESRFHFRGYSNACKLIDWAYRSPQQR